MATVSYEKEYHLPGTDEDEQFHRLSVLMASLLKEGQEALSSSTDDLESSAPPSYQDLDSLPIIDDTHNDWVDQEVEEEVEEISTPPPQSFTDSSKDAFLLIMELQLSSLFLVVTSCFSLSSVVLTGAIGFCVDNRTRKDDGGVLRRRQVKRIACEQISVASGGYAGGLHGGRGRVDSVERIESVYGSSSRNSSLVSLGTPKGKVRRVRRCGPRKVFVREAF
jgi:hypothetical protein